MTEPKTPITHATPPELVARSTFLLISAWVLFAISILLALFATILAAEYEKVFSSLGGVLPAFTRFFLKGCLLCWYFPAIALYIAAVITGSPLYTKSKQNNIARGLVALFFAIVITISVGAVAVYPPILDFGTTD